jgi:pimeloyl-ACP methyl ester carboxylesterase
LARAGFQVYFTNRWPGMATDTTFADVAERHAEAPIAIVAAKRVKIENPADAIAVLRAEDAFNVRDRLDDIQTETLVICGAQDDFWTPEMFAETACRLPRGKLIMYSQPWTRDHHCPRVLP